jgi:NADPH2:quinone reductase
MKAVYYTKTGSAKSVLKIDTFDDPIIKTDEVLLEMIYSSVNPADTKKRSGWISKKIDHDFIIPHSDGAGKVVEVADKKNKSLIGKNFWICGGSKDQKFGSCASFFSVKRKNILEIPNKISISNASCLGVPVATAFYSLFADKKHKEKFIFVSGGAGAVSQYAIQFAKLTGSKVITTVSSEKKEKICKELGVDLVINYKKLNEKEIVDEVIDFTKGDLVDRCIEVDFGYNMQLLPKLLKNNGVISSYSSSTFATPKFPYYLYAPKGINIKIVQAFLHENRYLQQIGSYVNRLINLKKLKHPSIKTFDIKNAYKSHEFIEDKKTIGKSNIKI